MRADEVGPDHPGYGGPVQPRTDVDDPKPDATEDGDVLADRRPPEQWVTGEDPATPRQLAVLKDRGIGVPEDLTKARASQLISQHVYAGARA